MCSLKHTVNLKRIVSCYRSHRSVKHGEHFDLTKSIAVSHTSAKRFSSMKFAFKTNAKRLGGDLHEIVPKGWKKSQIFFSQKLNFFWCFCIFYGSGFKKKIVSSHFTSYSPVFNFFHQVLQLKICPVRDKIVTVLTASQIEEKIVIQNQITFRKPSSTFWLSEKPNFFILK